ncbi:MAG TPA: hypothetical protein VH008_04595, partial [Pseudonocardia sp.]|nr:hypothetical protein [Pseudonocardia sp.]
MPDHTMPDLTGPDHTRLDHAMPDQLTPVADTTAVRTALWRALHRLVDASPPVFDDEVGLRLADPEDGWR